MQISAEDCDAIGVALNEAILHGVEVDPERRVVGVTLEIRALPAEGSPPADARVQVLLRPVGRIAAALLRGASDSPDAKVVPFAIEELPERVDSVPGGGIYGWKFVDVHEEQLRWWGSKLSLDWRSGEDGLSHSLYLFKDLDANSELDLLIWFDSFRIFTPDFREIEFADFLAGGRRWWEAFRANDPRTAGHGLVPLREPDA